MMECLEGLTDPRQEKKVLHNFIETIMLVICAVIAGCDVWEDIADYCRVKEAWFREKLGLKLENGIPSHDTMERVFGMLNPEEFQKRIIEWVQKSCGKQAREVINVDGKTMRGRKRAKTHSHGERVGEQSAGSIWAEGGRGKEQRNHSSTGIAGAAGYRKHHFHSRRHELPERYCQKNQRKRRGLCNRAKRQSAYAVQGNKRVLHQRIGNASILSVCQPDKNLGERSWQDRNERILSLYRP